MSSLLRPALVLAAASLFGLLALPACDGGRDIPPGEPGAGSRPDGGPGRDAGPGADATVLRSGTHAARCLAGCAPPADGPCAAADQNACANDCTVLAEGLAAACATCILEESGWSGQRCSCIGTGCNLCGFAPGGVACDNPAPTDTCTAADETCRGFAQAPATEGACAEVCVGEGTTPALGSLDDRCAVACSRVTGPCASADQAACVSSCRTRFAGLPVVCTLCALEDSGWTGERCSCLGEGCTACSFGPGGRACAGALPTDTCSAADESCDGIEWGATGSGRCAELCR